MSSEIVERNISQIVEDYILRLLTKEEAASLLGVRPDQMTRLMEIYVRLKDVKRS